MRFYEEQQFEMLGRVAGFLKDNTDRLAAKVPALGELINYFVEKHKALYNFNISKRNIVSISTREKKTNRDGLVNNVKMLSEMLHAHYYGDDHKTLNEAGNDSGKKVKFDYSFSILKRMSGKDLCKVTQEVVTAAKQVRHVQQYGITHDDIKVTEAYYTEFSASKDKPLKSKKETATKNLHISKEIKECISLLDNRIDRLMSIATRDDGILANAYNSSRKVLGSKFGRPTDQEVRYRKSRQKKITGDIVKKALFVD